MMCEKMLSLLRAILMLPCAIHTLTTLGAPLLTRLRMLCTRGPATRAEKQQQGRERACAPGREREGKWERERERKRACESERERKSAQQNERERDRARKREMQR